MTLVSYEDKRKTNSNEKLVENQRSTGPGD